MIGINTAIHENGEGIGFAIPINATTRIVAALVRDGRPPAHAYLGIQMDTLTPDLAAKYNADPNTGVLVEATPGVLVTKVRFTRHTGSHTLGWCCGVCVLATGWGVCV